MEIDLVLEAVQMAPGAFPVSCTALTLSPTAWTGEMRALLEAGVEIDMAFSGIEGDLIDFPGRLQPKSRSEQGT